MRWPLVGRDDELARMVAAFRTGRAVVLTGAAGVGKSRLAAEAASADGATPVRVTATADAAHVPFGAFGPLLPGALPDANPVGAAATALLDGSLRSTVGTPVRLLVDDAHKLDHASAALVHHLARSGAVGLVVTLRTGEQPPDAVSALWKNGDAERLDLAPLDERSTRGLLEAALGGTVHPGSGREMWRVSAGVVLYLRELVMAGLADGSLSLQEGSWVWRGERAPARLGELVSERLGTLSAAQRDAVELVAMAEPLDMDVLAGLVGDEVIEVLEERHVIAVEDDSELVVRLGHPLYGEVLLGSCPTVRRRRHLVALADAVERSERAGHQEVVRVARWRLDAGASQDARNLLSAARLAWGSGDGSLSIELARGALDTSGGVTDMAVRASVAVDLAERMTYMGRASEALDVLDGAPPGADVTVRSRAAVMRAFALDELERIEESDEVIDSVRVGADGLKPDDRVLVLGSCAGIISARDCTRSLAILEELTVDDVVRADRLDFLACWAALLAISGRRREADRCVQLCLDAGDERLRRDPVAVGHLAYASLTAATLSGDLGEPEHSMALTLERYPADGGFAYPRHMTLYHRAHVLRLRGRYAAALELIEDPDVLETDHVAGALCCAEAAFCLVMLGRLDDAEELARRARRDRARHLRLMLVDTDVATIWRAAALGDRSRARELASALADEMRALGALGWEMFVLEDLVRLGGADLAVDRLEEIARIQGGQLAQTCAAHARYRAGDRLQSVAADFEAMGMLAHAAAAHADASRAFTREGRAAAAQRAAWRARALARQCDAVSLPSLVTLSAPRLTPRERDIAQLASTGMTSREIAQRLTLSVRTVENHLYTAYGKLGVHAREELRDLFRSPGPSPERTRSPAAPAE